MTAMSLFKAVAPAAGGAMSVTIKLKMKFYISVDRSYKKKKITIVLTNTPW
jgi:hypothetical protein